jgi:hypothetical protein
LAVFVIFFLVHLRFLSSFLVRSFYVPIWVLVSIVRSIIRCFSHILPAFLLLLLLYPILISSYYSYYFSSFGIDFKRARFASSPASSFPVIPTCPGTQHSVTFPYRLSMSCLIFLVFGFFVWLLPNATIMVLSESVDITLLTPVAKNVLFCRPVC